MSSIGIFPTSNVKNLFSSIINKLLVFNLDCMRILLTVPSLDVKEFKGLARFSLELYERLKDKMNIEILEVYEPKVNYFKNLFHVPLRQMISKADIIHSTTPESGAFLPFLNKKSVVSFHDFIPMKMKVGVTSKTKAIQLRLYTTFLWRLAAHCRVITANSSQTAKEIKDFCGRDAKIINPGVDKKFKPLKRKKGSEKITLGFFSNFSYRKRVDIAIEVFKILKEKIDCRLILAGGRLTTSYQRHFNVEKLLKGLKDVKIVEYVDEKDVVKLYNSFDFFLFPSLYEGFGLPILEAQKCGVPVLILKWAKIPPETKRFAIKCRDVREMSEKILHLVENKKEYRKIARRGEKYASQFTWERFTEEYVEIYESLA